MKSVCLELDQETTKYVQEIARFKNISEDEAIALVLQRYAKKHASQIQKAQRVVERIEDSSDKEMFPDR